MGCSGGGAPADLISVSNGGCGGSWQLAAPGWYTFQVRNAAAENADVDLVNPATGAVYAEVEALGPGTAGLKGWPEAGVGPGTTRSRPCGGFLTLCLPSG